MLVVGFVLSSSAQAATIIWVSDNLNSNDTVWITLLELNGYSVDPSFADKQGKELDAAEIAALNAADLIIVTRNLTAVDYADDGTEVSVWNGIATPLMALAGQAVHANTWNWFNTTSLKNTNVNMTAEVPSHPVFDGIAFEAGNQVSVVTNNCKTVNSTSAGNGSVIGKRFDDDGVWIATWEKGVEFYSGAGQTAGDLRMFFAAGKTDGGAGNYGKYNLTAEGEKMFLNAVAYMIGLLDLDPSQASEPEPKNKAIDVSRTPTLTWTPGDSVQADNEHDVYFGETLDDVNDANSTVYPDVNYVNVDVNNFDPEPLELGKTYYWRVDEINDNDPNVWKGDVWHFTVAESLVVDDMESYTPWNIPDNNLFDTWSDGYGNMACDGGNGTGSLIYLEQDLNYVHGGEKAMILVYDNDGKIYCEKKQAEVDREAYSKVKIDIDDLPSQIGPNWLADGAEVLVLWFQGNVEGLDNIEPMSVELTDGSDGEASVPYGFYPDEDDVNDIYDGQWHEWNIALQDFNAGPTPVDLEDVNSIAIIIGDRAGEPSGTGTMYFDDIRLYRPKCVLGRRSSDFALLDYAPESTGGDCFVNNIEVEVMAENWLGAVPIMAPVTVPDAGFDDQFLLEGGYLYISDTK